MDPLLKTIDARLREMLAPLLKINGWEIEELLTEDFSNQENFNALVSAYRSRLPGAFLSFPTITYQQMPPRVPHFTADYYLMVGSQTRLADATVHDFIWQFHDRANHLVYLQKIQDYDLPANLDFIRPRNFNFAEIQNDSGPIGVAMFGFAVEVRNWEINDPA